MLENQRHDCGCVILLPRCNRTSARLEKTVDSPLLQKLSAFHYVESSFGIPEGFCPSCHVWSCSDREFFFCGDYPQLRAVRAREIGGEGSPEEVARANREQKETAAQENE